jgi:hypothetical protein
MLILGLDPAQKTGWGLYDTRANLSAMRCGVLKFDAIKKEFERNAGLLGPQLRDLIKEIGRPDFAVIEMAPRQPAGFFRKGKKPATTRFMGAEVPAQDGDEEGGGGGLQSTLSTNQMAAALSSVLGCFNIPFEPMKDSTWRKAAYGFGTRAGWVRDDWKKHARQMCRQMRITATNDDMAEACWIAYAGAGCQAFKMLTARAA